MMYGAEYYENYHPRPYTDTDFWREFFGEMAGHIVRTLDVNSVLDVGCALGVLVSELRERDIQAHGIDFSKWAIANSVAPEFCREASILEPPQRRYDLVTCIEVAEHLPERHAATVIKHLCEYADVVLFSSVPEQPEGIDDPTHLNVQPARYWNRLFLAHGYRRDPMCEPFHLLPWGQLWRKYQ